MRKRLWVLAFVVALALTVVGCGSSDEPVSEATPSDTTAASASPDASPATASWTTVTTLKSSDPQKIEGILISEPFEVHGTAKLELDMPDGGRLDGVIGVIIPSDKATDSSTILKAITDGVSVTLMPSAATQEVPDLDGTYVLVDSVPTDKTWSVKIMTQK